MMFSMRPLLIIGTLFFLFAIPAYADHRVDINAASAEELDTLPGIGPAIAGRIIEYREGPDGPFETIEEISNVQGIGDPGSKSYEGLKGHITVSGASATSQPSATSQSAPAASASSSALENAPPAKNISVSAGADRTVFVGADSTFEAFVSGALGEPLPSARVVWSFGNGDHREGRSVRYNFAYPGTYVVVVDAVSGMYSATDRLTVTATPAALSVSAVTADYIALLNAGAVETDIGGWLLFSGGRQFQFPPHTVLLPGQEVFVSNKHTGLSGADPATVALQYPNGLVAASYEYPLFLSRPRTAQGGAAAGAIVSANATGSGEQQSNEAAELNNASLITAPAVAVGDGTPFAVPALVWWLLALFALVAVSASGVVVARHRWYKEYSIKELHD